MISTRSICLTFALLISTASLKPQPLIDQLVNQQIPTVSEFKQALLHGIISMASFAGAATLTGSMLYDTPYRWLLCKQTALQDMKELAEQVPSILSQAELNGSTVVQALSYVPTVFWRELACLPIIGLLAYISVKEFKKCAELIA